MDATPTADRRRHQRIPLATGVQFFHSPSRRDFPGRCVDVSGGGMLMYVPVTTPVKVGQPIRLDMAAVGRPDFRDLGERPVDGTIVRVNRHSLLAIGQVAVGVRFAGD